MTTLQEYLNNKYPTKEDKEKVQKISVSDINRDRKRNNLGIKEEIPSWNKKIDRSMLLDGGQLDLKDFKKLEELEICGSYLKSPLNRLSLKDCDNLKELKCHENNFTSLNFLDGLPNLKKLEILTIYGNDIQSTDIEIFSELVNLKTLKIGNTKNSLDKGKKNKFYGSLKSYQNLTKLGSICIEATDVDDGLEYLPSSLNYGIKKEIANPYLAVECSSHGTDAKCKAIQDQLRPFDYDLEVWQLANFEKVLEAQPEFIVDKHYRNKWMDALKNKITQSYKELQESKTNLPEKVKKITRLENKLAELKKAKEGLEKGTQTENFSIDKSTQTEITKEAIMEMLQKLEIHSKK